MSNKYNDIICERIREEVEKIPFVREEDKDLYGRDWYANVLESEQSDIFKVQPPIYYMQPATDEWLHQQEQNFINSFSE